MPSDLTKDKVRLPRSRGDRPAQIGGTTVRLRAPPLPRGSTHMLLVAGFGAQGSPAPAGIDPPPASDYRSAKRLPRSRGDRPGYPRTTGISSMAPPLPRGSTRSSRRQSPARYGSPAPAGIDPWRGRRSTWDRWLPRSRGDRPQMRHSRHKRATAPPLPRGSTRPMPQPSRTWIGSPAPAGIDR